MKQLLEAVNKLKGWIAINGGGEGGEEGGEGVACGVDFMMATVKTLTPAEKLPSWLGVRVRVRVRLGLDPKP